MTENSVCAESCTTVTPISVSVHKGIRVERVSVSDISQDARYVADRMQTQADIDLIDSRLAGERHWAAPCLADIGGRRRLRFNNPVAAQLFGSAPALRIWRERFVPRAIALTPVYEAESWFLPTGEPIDPKTRGIFLYSLDAIGVRTRASILAHRVSRYVEPHSVTRWTSIASGAAIPVLNAVARNLAGRQVSVTLVDIDPEALHHARQKASALGLVEGRHYELLRRNVISDLIVTDNLVRALGEHSQNMVDMLGIFEYIDEEFAGRKSAATFLVNAFRLVKPGGALVGANMLNTRPQLHFNQRAVGWPRIIPRSLDQIHRIIVDAGINPNWVTMRIAADGIYAVFEIARPKLDPGSGR